MANVPVLAESHSPSDAAKPGRYSVLVLPSRVGRTVVFAFVIVISLLTFPSSIPWMIAFWLVWHTVAMSRGQPAWVPLLACVAILLAKRIYWPPTLVVFSGLAVAVAAGRAMGTRSTASRRYFSWSIPFVLWCAWAAVLIEWRAIATCSRPLVLDSSRSVVCIGDSLTSGLLPDRGYPDRLAKLIRPPVINLGQSGMCTEGGVKRLSRVSRASASPLVVVIELGGHDFLKGRSRAATKENLTRLIDACREMGADVALMEIPRGFMTDPFRGLEREIAHEEDVELVSDSAIRQLVLWSPVSPPGMWLPRSRLSDDGIHANARGSAYLARHVARTLARMYGREIRDQSFACRGQFNITPHYGIGG
ncbi:MAG: GDSL-type esterase/lipase family protein [Planctomycetota bacterium]